jgi:hypothetical protein
MNQKLNLTIALIAGLIGGALSSKLILTRVHAQSTAPEEIRAQSFVLVDRDGAVLGTFSNDSQGKFVNGKQAADPVIKLFDERGREIWSAGGAAVSLRDTPPRPSSK